MSRSSSTPAARSTVRPAQPEEIREALGALPGSLGAVGTSPYRITR